MYTYKAGSTPLWLLIHKVFSMNDFRKKILFNGDYNIRPYLHFI